MSHESYKTALGRFLPRSRVTIPLVLTTVVVGASLALFAIVSGPSVDRGTRESAADEVREFITAGDPASARVLAEEAISDGDVDPVTFALLGKACEATGDLDAAEEAYRRSLYIDPAQPDTQHDFAVVAFHRGDADTAEEALRAALELNPGLVGSRVLLGDVLAHKGDRAGAAREYRDVIEAAPAGLDLVSIENRLAAVQ